MSISSTSKRNASLPENPNPEHLQKKAKALLKAFHRRDESVCQVLKTHRKFAELSSEELFKHPLCLREVQHAMAQYYGYKNWASLIEQTTAQHDACICHEGIMLNQSGKLTNAIREIVTRIEFPLVAELVGYHPDRIAAILMTLNLEAGAKNLESLQPELQAKVISALTAMNTESWLASLSYTIGKLTPENRKVSGLLQAAETMNRMDSHAMNDALDILDQTSPTTAQNLRQLLFTFDDLLCIHGTGLATLVEEIPQGMLSLALKTAKKQLWEKLAEVLPRAKFEEINSQTEALGPVRIADVEEAQKTIVEKVRLLEEQGVLVIVSKS